MLVFSERVSPTFTSSNQNILYVKDCKEIFFNVFEIEINGQKFVAERVGTSINSEPVLCVPIEYNNIRRSVDFIIIVDNTKKTSVIVNKNCLTEMPTSSVKAQYNSKGETLIDTDSLIVEEDIPGLDFTADSFSIGRVKELIHTHYTDIRSKVLEQVDSKLARDEKRVKDTINTAQQNLVEEFIRLSNNSAQKIENDNTQQFEELNTYISEQVSKASEQLKQSSDANYLKAVETFKEKIDTLASNIITNTLVKIVNEAKHDANKNISQKFEVISKSVKDLIQEQSKEIRSDLTVLEAVLGKSNVELKSYIDRRVNRALSRIGTVKTQTDAALKSVVSDFEEKISVAENTIKEFYDEKLKLVLEHVDKADTERTTYFENLFNASKNTVLTEVQSLRESSAPIVEKASEVNDKSYSKLKKDLEKSISQKFTTEISSLKRMVELQGGGGGSVAMQFAAGGTMNGNLTIVGSISAAQYLGIPGTGGAFLPLSGGTVTGDTVFQQGISALSMTLSGQQVATVVTPTRTTLSGNGILSSFAISGAGNLTNPSALIVAIDGALQEPSVDYSVAGGNITFTSPLASGAKAVVVCPTNTVQVLDMIPADGSVTSAKLASGLSISSPIIEGALTLNATTYAYGTGAATQHMAKLVSGSGIGNVFCYDEFIGTSQSGGGIGELGWGGVGTATIRGNEQNHPGIFRMSSAGTGTLYLNYLNAVSGTDCLDGFTIEAVFRVADVASCQSLFGLGYVNSYLTNGFRGLHYDSSLSANWRLLHYTQAGASTYTDTGKAAVNNDWVKVSLTFSNGSTSCTICTTSSSTAVTVTNTGAYTATTLAHCPQYVIKALSGTKTIDIDAFMMHGITTRL